uniref:RxLR effector candidate protein n=1 Tax=Hyaloperonospora arabidopsidis (strain Emoy2) TaxID=559515 RepID=A0A090BH74_HYAAE|nr:RxLR effector candidate protein [Hyaloperonospora arabidopsidis Emoy2]
MDTSGLERAGKGGEFEEKSKTVPRDQGGNNELLDLMRGLAGRLERLGSSQTELRKEVAHGVKAGREMGDHPRTPDRSPSMFESALGRGPRMHLDSLSETPEREANRRRYFDGDHDGYLRSISVDMVTQITYDNPTVILELIEFHAWVGGDGDLNEKIALAQSAREYFWPEDVKVDLLGYYLDGMDVKYFNKQIDLWWSQNATLQYAMERASDGNSDFLVQNNIVLYASQEMRVVLMAKVGHKRTDYLQQAEEFAHFAQSWESGVTNKRDWLDDSEDASGTCVQPDGKPLNITKKGSVTLILTAMGQRHVVTITDVYYAHGLKHNLISYGTLDQKGYTLASRGTQRVLTSADGKHVIFDVDLMRNVLTVHAKLRKNLSSERNVVMSAIGGEERSAQDLPVIAQQGSLLSDVCPRKATKNRQPQKDSGDHSPIDRIGGVVCSDLKGQMTPRDRLGNRYMINFVDYESNYVKIFLAETKDKNFAQRGQRGFIVGIGESTKGYQVYLPKEKVVVTSQHANNIETLTVEQNEQVARRLVQDEPIIGENGVRVEKKKAISNWTRERPVTRSSNKIITASSPTKLDKDDEIEVVNIAHELDPKKYNEAIRSTQKDACLHSKWVYKTKRDADGELERYKARFVACGNEQVFGRDYNITFAAVMDMSSVKIILALARKWRVPAKHGDIPNAHVKAEKYPELRIFLRILQGMKIRCEVCENLGATRANELALELRKALYGLKLAGWLWGDLLHAKLESLNFTQCLTDTCVYWKHMQADFVIFGEYVDDLLVTATRSNMVDDSFGELKELSVKDLGTVSKFLGMRIDYDDGKG